MKIIERFYRKVFINENATMQYSPAINGIIEAFMQPQNFQNSIQKILSNFQISHTHCARLFKKHTDQTMQAFFLSKKGQYACSLLKNTDYKISTISELVGYESQSYFVCMFKKAIGITPIENRKQHAYIYSMQ
jgi:AraC-like DNA-binding protein